MVLFSIEIVKFLLKLVILLLKTEGKPRKRSQSENTMTLTENRISPPLNQRSICPFLCLLGVRGLKGHRSQTVINLFVSRSYSTEPMNSMLALSLYAYKVLSTVCHCDVTNNRTICLPSMSLVRKACVNV